MEIPAYIGGIFVMDKLGRRPTLSGGLIISGIACLITGLVPEGELFYYYFSHILAQTQNLKFTFLKNKILRLFELHFPCLENCSYLVSWQRSILTRRICFQHRQEVLQLDFVQPVVASEEY